MRFPAAIRYKLPHSRQSGGRIKENASAITPNEAEEVTAADAGVTSTKPKTGKQRGRWPSPIGLWPTGWRRLNAVRAGPADTKAAEFRRRATDGRLGTGAAGAKYLQRLLTVCCLPPAPARCWACAGHEHI